MHVVDLTTLTGICVSLFPHCNGKLVIVPENPMRRGVDRRLSWHCMRPEKLSLAGLPEMSEAGDARPRGGCWGWVVGNWVRQDILAAAAQHWRWRLDARSLEPRLARRSCGRRSRFLIETIESLC